MGGWVSVGVGVGGGGWVGGECWTILSATKQQMEQLHTEVAGKWISWAFVCVCVCVGGWVGGEC